jgi:tRNA (guanine-N7-)-methyltransferase
VSEAMLNEYAYLLQPGGRLYTITDVEVLHLWHVDKCTNHPCFERIDEETLAADPCVAAMISETEEGKKVARMNGQKYYAVFRRRDVEEMKSLPKESCPVYGLFG